jgi:hypothetical protein
LIDLRKQSALIAGRRKEKLIKSWSVITAILQTSQYRREAGTTSDRNSLDSYYRVKSPASHERHQDTETCQGKDLNIIEDVNMKVYLLIGMLNLLEMLSLVSGSVFLKMSGCAIGAIQWLSSNHYVLR